MVLISGLLILMAKCNDNNKTSRRQHRSRGVCLPLNSTHHNSGDAMTLQKATDLGWKITGTEDDVTAEKGRLIHMGPLVFVLKMIEKSAAPL